MTLKIIITSLISLSLTSCVWVLSGLVKYEKTEVMYRDSKSKKDYLVIHKHTNGQCGCSSVSVLKYTSGHLVYSLSYACNPLDTPRKVIQSFDASGNLLLKQCYAGTNEKKYSVPLNEFDKRVNWLLDSISKIDTTGLQEYRLCVPNKYTGYYSIFCRD